MKKKRERKKEFRGKGGKGKKKSSAGFKPVRLVLVFLSVEQEGVVGRIGFTFLPSWATLFTVVQPAVSSNPASPLCWVFCLCLRELVGPAGLCKPVLGRCCRCGPWQAIRQLISQSCSFVLGTCKQQLQQLWVWEARKRLGARSGPIQPPLAWDARSGAGGGFSCLGFRKLASGFVLGKRAASRPSAW